MVTKNGQSRRDDFHGICLNIVLNEMRYPPLSRLPEFYHFLVDYRFRYSGEFYFYDNAMKPTKRNTQFSKCEKFYIFCNLLYLFMSQ